MERLEPVDQGRRAATEHREASAAERLEEIRAIADRAALLAANIQGHSRRRLAMAARDRARADRAVIAAMGGQRQFWKEVEAAFRYAADAMALTVEIQEDARATRRYGDSR